MKRLSLSFGMVALLGGSLCAEGLEPLVWQILQARYDQVKPYVSDGRILVARGGKFGFADTAGKEVIATIYHKAQPFSEGVATVGIGEQPNCKFGMIDPNGSEVVAPVWDYLGRINEGYAVAYKRTTDMRRYALIDAKGGVVELPYAYCSSFANGFAMVGKGVYKETTGLVKEKFEGKFGFITPDAHEAIALQFDDAHEFQTNGLAAVGVQGKYYIKWGFIDRAGTFVIPCNYFSAGYFVGNLAQVSKVVAGGTIAYGYINEQGEEVIPCCYTWASDFRFANTWVGMETDGEMRYMLIDKRGNSLLSHPVYNIQEGGKLGLAVAAIRNEQGQLRYGILNNAGETALPFEYDEMSIFSERDPKNGQLIDGAMATKKGESFSFDISKKQ